MTKEGSPIQLTPIGASSEEIPLIPVRMVNEFVYCPRLAYLMWVQQEWEDSSDTVEGRRVHRSTDIMQPPLPKPADYQTPSRSTKKLVTRSLTLSSERLGIIAKLDIAESFGNSVLPVEYKKGKRPRVPQGAYDPERIQLCLQGLLLEEHGYRVIEGAIYYAGSHERVIVKFDEALKAQSLKAVCDLRTLVQAGTIPPPLEDSPKCPRCALVGICLPDETHELQGKLLSPRPIAVPNDHALPLIVQSFKAQISKDGETLKITEDSEVKGVVRFIDVSDVALFGNVSITTPALAALMEREIPVTFHSHGGWLRGIAQGLGHRNVEVRTAQYRFSFDPARCLEFARELVSAKIANQRTMIRRNWQGSEEERKPILRDLASSKRSLATATTMQELLGIEGEAAAIYFRAFANLLRSPDETDSSLGAFDFQARNRRPPLDPVNALLSLGYAILTRHMTIALSAVGLDPYRGLFHAMRYGKPALALDIMEPFRPLVIDSVILSTVNTGEITGADFTTSANGTALTESGRRCYIAAIERRLSVETTHPIFGYRVSMRRLIMVQARLLSRFLLGELPSYPNYIPR